MKRLTVTFFLLIVVLGCAFSSDYEDGYRKGYADALAGKPNAYAASSTEKDNSLFEITYFVDSFGDPTNKGFISQKDYSSGTFSNSATTNSKIFWYVILAKDQAAFVIYEYERTRITGSSAYPNLYSVSIKTEDGKVETFKCQNFSDRISVDKSDLQRFTDTLLKEGIIKISIVEDTKYSASSYNLGSVDFTGIRELYSELQQMEMKVLASTKRHDGLNMRKNVALLLILVVLSIVGFVGCETVSSDYSNIQQTA